jgi:hypothetical protein
MIAWMHGCMDAYVIGRGEGWKGEVEDLGC